MKTISVVASKVVFFHVPCRTTVKHRSSLLHISKLVNRSLLSIYTVVYTRSKAMTTIKAGVREFCERIASFLESETPVAVTRRGETVGVYVPTR